MFAESPIKANPRFEMGRKVRWRETDASGVVQFESYVRMMEETEYAFLRSRGLRVVLEDDRGVFGFPRLNVSVKVERPAVFDEQLWITLEMTYLDGKQIVYHFEVVDDEAQSVATGKFKVACCRFLPGELPFAILTPDFVLDALNE